MCIRDSYIDGDFIKARGTTLGADNGVGVVFMMCILEDDELPHPPIECCISVQEEVGKKGGTVFDASTVKGKRLMDFNWHKPDTIFAGCAGDISAYVNIPVAYEDATDTLEFGTLSLAGGRGGHSEFDIHLERVNAIASFARVIDRIGQKAEVHLIDLESGDNRYVIPGAVSSVIAYRRDQADAVRAVVEEVAAELGNEYRIADPDISLTLVAADGTNKVITYADTVKVARTISLIPVGVQSMSLEIEGLVESSNTVAMVETKDGIVSVLNTIPSAVTSRRYDILRKVRDLASLVGAEVTTFADCPEWAYKADSKLLATAKNAYKVLNGVEPNVEVSHSSLELGLFCKKIPGLECISLGPIAYDVHTPRERLNWTTVAPVWEHIKEILKELDY